MKTELLLVGRTDDERIASLTDEYAARIGRYVPFEVTVIPDLKNRKVLPEAGQKGREGELILERLSPSDRLVLMDEAGKEYSSEQFADYYQKSMNAGYKRLVFAIGGPYGFSEAVYRRADGKLSLSRMTFSHQMVRLFFAEQLYRALTILRGEPYHHGTSEGSR